MKSVNEVSKLSGVSRRTLQYYDEIGLLPPSEVKKSGYRQYDDESLRRLWNILFYKELGLSLDDIRLLLESPKDMEKVLIQRHKQILLEKQSQLQKLLHSVDRVLNDEFDISMLRDFDKNRIEATKTMYANEIRTVFESSFFLPAVKSNVLRGKVSIVKNASNIMNFDFGKLISLSLDILQRFREAMEKGPNSKEASEAVVLYKEFLNTLFPCDDNTFREIGRSYLVYNEELDKKNPGLAKFVYEAIIQVYP